MGNLLQIEAEERAATITVTGYRVHVDLDRGDTEFGAHSRVDFDCRRPGASTFLECAATRIHRITLNGTDLDPETHVEDGRIHLPRLRAANTVEVHADHRYTHDGQGLHRFTDPADGRVYLYTQHEVYDAHKVFACFDQPDLKAPLTLLVTAPADWVVLANSPISRQAGGRWEFSTSKPLATYFMGLAAGHYVGVEQSYGRLPLGVYCRASLLTHLDHDEIFEITRQSLDHLDEQFGIPFPFDKYDQVFVPEFNAGGMENAALTTLRDDLIFSSPVADDRRTARAVAIAHELAHMWFGDLVTMKWWNDLWLNESFAEVMAFQTVSEATRFETAWARFAVARKNMGYRADQEPGTHPVSAEVVGTADALANFDGITYAKGAGVLRQLMAWIGRDEFFGGLHDYLTTHAFGNATFADLLGALSARTGRDLDSWADSWLRTANVNTLAVEATHRADGTFARVAITQSAPETHPVLRAHRITLGCYEPDRGGVLRRHEQFTVDVKGETTEIPALADRPVCALIVPNDSDETWAKARFDSYSLATLRDSLARIEDPVARGVCWQALWDMTYDGHLPVGDYLATVLPALPHEQDPSLIRIALVRCRTAIDVLGSPSLRADRQRSLARCCRTLGRQDDAQTLAIAAFIEAAQTSEDVEEIQRWLSGGPLWTGELAAGETRWAIVRRLATLGLFDSDQIAREQDRDGTVFGRYAAITAVTALPDPDRKAHALSRLSDAAGGSNHELRAYADGLFSPDQLDLGEAYLRPAVELLVRLWEIHDPWLAARLARRMFPKFHATALTTGIVDSVLAANPDPRARKVVLDHDFELNRAVRARAADHSGCSSTPRQLPEHRVHAVRLGGSTSG